MVGLCPYLRTVKTVSGATAVQIVYSSRRPTGSGRWAPPSAVIRPHPSSAESRRYRTIPQTSAPAAGCPVGCIVIGPGSLPKTRPGLQAEAPRLGEQGRRQCRHPSERGVSLE